MRRGFKAWCETTAENHRAALQLKPEDPLDPKKLADHLGITVWQPEDVPDLAEDDLQQLTINDRDSWSAVTIQVSDTNLIIVNSAHAPTRQRSSLSHEISHLILDHEPGRIDLSPSGHLLLSSFEREQEEEADWLSGTLLVPRDGLKKLICSTQDPSILANHFGISVKMLNWRLRMTGVVTQARRTHNRSRRKASIRN